MRRLLIILIACALVSVPVVGSSATEQRIALVIGNGNYMTAPLRNPVNDATDMALVLKRLGFKVTLRTDSNQRVMERSIRDFGKQLRDGGVGLFYYAGHGVQVKGSNYLLPIGAEVESEGDVKYEAVDAGLVLAKMEDAGNGLNIVILDACRDNPFARSFRSGSRGLARMDAPTGSILAYSTAPGSVAADGAGRNGLYTQYLLKHISTSKAKIEDIFKQVRIDVLRESGKKQTPWESSSLMGDFYFNSGKTGSSQSARAIGVEKRQSPQNLNAEEELWEIVKTSSVAEDFLMFLDEYPNSRFTTHARLKIQQLKRKQNAQTLTAAVAPAVVKPKPVKSVTESADSNAGVISSEGNYTKYSTGIVYDKKTGLEWYAGPDRDMSWYEANSWIKNLDVGGGGWRMPKEKDLRSLYWKRTGTRNITLLLKTTGWYVWSIMTAASGGSWCHYFYFQGSGSWGTSATSSSAGMRGFAVRTRKDVAQIKPETKKPNDLHASIAPVVADQGSSNSRRAAQNSYRLALFPAKIISSWGSKTSQYEHYMIKAIDSVSKGDNRLEFAVTYMRNRGLPDTVLLMSDRIGEKQIVVWKKKSFLSKSEPDWNQISKICKEIDADIGVLIHLSIAETGKADIYLYNRKGEKIYSKIGANINFSSVYANVERFVSVLMLDFFRDQ
jgi:hypothetical protein